MSNIVGKKPAQLMLLLIGFGPLIAFVAAYAIAPVTNPEKIFVATAVLVATTIAATTASKILAQPTRLQTGLARLAVLVMGALTLALQEEVFIKMWPTLRYLLAALLMFSSLLIGRPHPQRLIKIDDLTSSEPGDARKVMGCCACVAVVMALLNEAVWRSTTTDFWIGFQLWSWIVFIVLIAPMLMLFGIDRKKMLMLFGPDRRDSNTGGPSPPR